MFAADIAPAFGAELHAEYGRIAGLLADLGQAAGTVAGIYAKNQGGKRSSSTSTHPTN